jgi:hypothetical protein
MSAALKRLENDGIYSIKSGQEGNVLVRLTCQSPGCPVKAKVIRYPAKLCIYTQGIHQSHNITPQKGLKKPALRYVQENPDKPQQQILKDLKQKGIHNQSWPDSRNKTAIKNAKQSTKKRPVVEDGPFHNLHELKIMLDARKQSIGSFLGSSDTTTQGTNVSPTNDTSALRNIIVLNHDIESSAGLEDRSEIIVTFPSALKTLKKAPLLWQTGLIQQEIDYSKGFWKGDWRQLGMVGISDANRTFHPLVISIQ